MFLYQSYSFNLIFMEGCYVNLFGPEANLRREGYHCLNSTPLQTTPERGCWAACGRACSRASSTPPHTVAGEQLHDAILYSVLKNFKNCF